VLFERAANKNSSSGMLGLAGLYMHGYGVEVDYQLAFKLFSRAVDQTQVGGAGGSGAGGRVAGCLGACLLRPGPERLGAACA
jgi:hypothetical protein